MPHHMAKPPQEDMVNNTAAKLHQEDMANNTEATANPTHHPNLVTATLLQPHHLVTPMVGPHNLLMDPAPTVHHQHTVHHRHTVPDPTTHMGLVPMVLHRYSRNRRRVSLDWVLVWQSGLWEACLVDWHWPKGSIMSRIRSKITRPTRLRMIWPMVMMMVVIGDQFFFSFSKGI